MNTHDKNGVNFKQTLIVVVLIVAAGFACYLSFFRSPAPAVYAPEFRPESGRNANRPDLH
jgi:hypothetical protein